MAKKITKETREINKQEKKTREKMKNKVKEKMEFFSSQAALFCALFTAARLFI
jgi:hypothetical protein